MPRLPIDYSKTIMYKLCCLDQSINDIYIGHTTDFTKRKASHKSACCNENLKEYNFKVYQFIREHGDFENWNMVQIEEYPCNNVREAAARETYWMKELKSTLNSCKSFQTEEERKKNLKQYQKSEIFKKYKKEYQKSEKYKEYQKEYRQSEKGKENKKIHNQKYKQNEKYKQQQKEYKQKKALYLNELKCYNF